MIGLAYAHRSMSNTCRVHDRIHPLQGGRQVLGAREVTDDCAGAVELHIDRTPQQHADEVPAPGKLAHQMPADETGRSGDRYTASRTKLPLPRHRPVQPSNQTQVFTIGITAAVALLQCLTFPARRL